jgi:PhnB protein
MYERLLGGKITTMLTYGDSPMAEQVQPEWRKRIVHATLEWNDYTLLGADMMPDDYERPQGFFVTVSVDGLERAKLLFEGLAEGGVVRLPFQETFWSQGFGVLIDRFGVPWEINCEPSPTEP